MFFIPKGYCQSVISIGPKTNQTFVWPKARIGDRFALNCSKDDKNLVVRYCYNDSNGVSQWSKVNDSLCVLPPEKRTEEIAKLTQVCSFLSLSYIFSGIMIINFPYLTPVLVWLE